MEITGALKAYLSPHSSLSPKDLAKPSVLQSLSFWGEDTKYADQNGYTFVGMATITFTPLGQDALISNKIDALRNEAVTIRADATAKVTRIESQIQNLLCLENDTPISGKVDDDDLPF